MEIFESPGRNYLRDLMDFGPAWYVSKRTSTNGFGESSPFHSPDRPKGKIPLATFLDFAIGATECLELLHHGLKVVHGEIRADAFHFNHDTGTVRIINFGSGARSFEHAGGLTSSGWSTLSRQAGIKNRLMFIAPEQTGRMSADPDYRTDTYSLGILFWTMLAGEPAFEGATPIDMMQAVLSKRLPPISNIRFDIPDVLSAIIQRMTQKQIDDRYHSATGLKHDLLELKRILGEGDSEALIDFEIGSKDVSSSFVLPTSILGRTDERDKIIRAMQKVANRQPVLHPPQSARMNSITTTSGSTISDHNDVELLEGRIRSSDVSLQERKAEGTSFASDRAPSTSIAEDPRSSDADIPINVEKPPLETTDSKDSVQTAWTMDSHLSGGTKSSYRSRPLSMTASRRSPKPRYGHRHRCEVIMIYGQAGLGKSSLVQSTQVEIRRLGNFASAKFDPARKVPFETMIRESISEHLFPNPPWRASQPCRSLNL